MINNKLKVSIHRLRRQINQQMQKQSKTNANMARFYATHPGRLSPSLQFYQILPCHAGPNPTAPPDCNFDLLELPVLSKAAEP